MGRQLCSEKSKEIWWNTHLQNLMRKKGYNNLCQLLYDPSISLEARRIIIKRLRRETHTF